MIASAPGKLVLSGAYVVLDGAPAVVAAVDRRAWADASRVATFESDELRAAFQHRTAPFVDTTALRRDHRKLGLGSSAALLVAAIGAVMIADGEVDASDLPRLRSLAAERAFQAHRRAQGGGSGIDVVTCAHGGIQLCQVDPARADLPSSRSVDVAAGLTLEAWVCPSSASTAQLLRPVRALSQNDPARYRAITSPAHDGAIRFADAIERGAIDEVIHAARQQRDAMEALSGATGAPILPSYLVDLDRLAREEGAVFAQSGAGGGDIGLFFGTKPSSGVLRARASELGLSLLTPLEFGAEGVRLDSVRDVAG